jgi:hypothetical protein
VLDDRLERVDFRLLEVVEDRVDLARFFDFEVLARRRLEVDVALLFVTRETPFGRL